jgi:tripartite-type tricarboxylate transporter receptor subunit TctC
MINGSASIQTRLLFTSLLGFALMGASPALADTFPNRTVRLIVPFPPGGTPDVIARLMTDKLSIQWKQPVIVENRPGASSNIGSDIVAKAPRDGHALLMVPNNVLTMNPLLSSKMPFNPSTDLVSVSMLGITPFLLVTGPSLNVSNIKELVAEAKRRPDGITYASSGVGSNQHMFAEMLRSLTGIPMTHVPYTGGPQSVLDILGGRVDMQFGAVTTNLEHVRAGKLRALAVVSQSRLAVLPDVPTVAETGVEGFDADGWIGLSATAGTPQDVLAQINRDVGEIMRDPKAVETLAGFGIVAQPGPAAAMDERIVRERDAWRKVISNAKITTD